MDCEAPSPVCCTNARLRDNPMLLGYGSCTSSVRLIRQPENRVKFPSFITCARRGFSHGLRAVFLSASADRPSVAVLYAPVGVAVRARHPWLDATPPTSAATPQALAGAETVCR